MAEGREYRIVIEYGSLPDESEVGGSPISQSPSGGSNQNKDGGNVAGKTIASTIGLAQPFVNSAMAMRSNEIATVTGSAQLARKQNLINSAVQGTMSAVQKGLVGGSVASAFGASTGLGAVIAIGIAAVQKVLDISVKAQDIENKIEAESTSLNVQRMRAGIAYNRSRAK